MAGAAINRVGERRLMVVGLVLQAAGMGWIALAAGPSSPYAELIAPLVMAGAGISMAMPPAQNVVMSSVAADDVGAASGAFTMMRQLGGVFGLAIVVTVFTGAGSYVSPTSFADGFTPALAVAAAFSAAGALSAALLPQRRHSLAPAAVPEPAAA